MGFNVKNFIFLGGNVQYTSTRDKHAIRFQIQ